MVQIPHYKENLLSKAKLREDAPLSSASDFLSKAKVRINPQGRGDQLQESIYRILYRWVDNFIPPKVDNFIPPKVDNFIPDNR